MAHKPVYIISGFLGAGKTTLMNRILTENHGYKFAVIVNEFGEIGLDADLLPGTQDFVKMDNGCLCCVLNEELAQTLQALTKRDDFDAVLLETTGVADPLPIAWTFFREAFVDHFRFGGIVTVVDVLHFEKAVREFAEVRGQVERADYLYLAKTRLSDSKQIVELTQTLKTLQPKARCIDDQDPDFYNLVFDFAAELSLKPPEHLHEHEPHFESQSRSLQNRTIALTDLEDFFENLPQSVYRAKAIFRDAKTAQIFVMHAVCGRVEFFRCDGATTLGVVVIGRGLPKNLLEPLAKF